MRSKDSDECEETEEKPVHICLFSLENVCLVDGILRMIKKMEMGVLVGNMPKARQGL